MNFDERKVAFLAEYKALIEKYKVDFITLPAYQPNNRGTWDFVLQTTIMDTTDQPTKSPFQMETS